MVVLIAKGLALIPITLFAALITAYTIVFIMQISNNVTVGYITIILSMLEH